MVNLDYLYNPDAAKEVLGNNHFSDKKLGFQVIEHGTILPRKDTDKDGKFSWVGFGGIVDSNGRYIKESYIHLGTGGAYTPPPNQFNIAQKPSFISVSLTSFGDTA